MAKRKAKKHQPKTIRRRRALIVKRDYGSATAPSSYVSVIHADDSRAMLVNVIVKTEAFQVACQIAAAAGQQSPDLTLLDVRHHWRTELRDHVRILQESGVTAVATRKDVEAKGTPWGDHIEYLMHEDVRRYRNWANGMVYELTLQDGRHCNTCRRTHYPSKARVGLFYGSDHDVSGLNAAIPPGYPKVTLKKVPNV